MPELLDRRSASISNSLYGSNVMYAVGLGRELTTLIPSKLDAALYETVNADSRLESKRK